MSGVGSFDKSGIVAVAQGVVAHGRGLGHTVGLPTANIDFPAQELAIEYGVYATIIEVDGIRYRSITNIGAKPTVESSGNAGIETNIFDFDQDIYGKTVRLEIYAFLRGIMKFASLEEVKAQTEIDKRRAIEFFEAGCFR